MIYLDGQRGAIIYTLIESCRERSIDPYAILRDVLLRLPTLSTSRYQKSPWEPGQRLRTYVSQFITANPVRAVMHSHRSEFHDRTSRGARRCSVFAYFLMTDRTERIEPRNKPNTRKWKMLEDTALKRVWLKCCQKAKLFRIEVRKIPNWPSPS